MKQELQSAHIYSESMVLIKGEEKMAQVRDYNKLAHDIIREVGGAENIVNATRCATRFRLVLKKTPEHAKEKIAEDRKSVV